MALNKLMINALKALSYHDIDVKKNYKLDRAIENFMHPPIKIPFRMWDREPTINGTKIPVRIFLPENERGPGILLFFHGGGWVSGNIDAYTNGCMQLANKTGLRVLSVDYRLAPEYPFPIGPEDCYHAARELVLHSGNLGVSPDDVILIGDSAGANLCAVVSLMARDRGEFSIKRQILLYPSTAADHSDESPYRSMGELGHDYLLTSKKIRDYIELYLTRPEDYENPYFAPLLASDLSNQPSTLILTAEYDPLRDEGEAYGERLGEAGNDVTVFRIPDALHGFFNLPEIFEPVKLCYEKINGFIYNTSSETKPTEKITASE